MSTTKLQNSIIRQVLNIKDASFLKYLNSYLIENKGNSVYNVTKEEKQFLEESLTDYKNGEIISNDEIFLKNEKWLNKEE